MDGIVVYDLNSKTSEMVKKEPLPFVPFEELTPSPEKKISNAEDGYDGDDRNNFDNNDDGEDDEDHPAHERDNKKDEETT